MQLKSRRRLATNIVFTVDEARKVTEARNKLRQSLAGFVAKAALDYATKVLNERQQS